MGVNIVEQEIKYLIKFLEKKNINCVLAEYGITGATLVKACKESNIPLVVHFHGFDAYKKNILQKYQVLYNEMFDYAKAIIAVSSDMKTQLIYLGATEEKVKYIPYGIDLNKFKSNKKIERATFYIAVGRFVEKKAPYLTILAFSRVLEKISSAKLVMVGNGPLLEICKQLVKSLGIEKAVDFKGVVSNEEVANLMEQAFCFVQHSITAESGDSEGTPLAILEASASSLPIVSTKHAGIKDAVRDGETGFLVEEGDIEGMARSMIKLYENKDMALTLGKKGCLRMRQQYYLNESIKKLWDLL